MDLVVKGTSQGIPKVINSPIENYYNSNFDKLMKESDINVERAQVYRDLCYTKHSEFHNNDLTEKLIKEAMHFSSRFLDNTAEFQDIK